MQMLIAASRSHFRIVLIAITNTNLHIFLRIITAIMGMIGYTVSIMDITWSIAQKEFFSTIYLNLISLIANYLH